MNRSDVRSAAELVLLLREEEASSPEEVMAEVRHAFPEVTLMAVFRELSAMEMARGNA